MTILNVVVFIAILIFPIMITLRIFRWQWHPNTRPCRWFGHDKKYVAIKTSGCVPHGSPESNGRPFTCNHNHQIGDNGIYIARWVCRRCPMMEEECLGRGKDWTIEHERLVPDVKRWANWSQDSPKAAWEKLKEIQKRLETKKCAAYCGSCGLMHTGGPCPGGLS